MDNRNSRKVTMRRCSKNTAIPQDLWDDAKSKFAAIWKGRKTLTPFTPEEEKRYLPEVIGISSVDHQFGLAVRRHWANFSIEIPFKGLELEIGIDENGDPVNVEEWVIYKMAQEDFRCALSKDDIDYHFSKWYIDDPKQTLGKDYKKLQNRRVAMKELLNASNDKLKTEWMLHVLNYQIDKGANDINSMQLEDRELLMENYANKFPLKFIELAQDNTLQDKAMIERAVSAKQIIREGESYYYGDQLLGKDVQSAIRKIKDPVNNAILIQLKENMANFFQADLNILGSPHSQKINLIDDIEESPVVEKQVVPQEAKVHDSPPSNPPIDKKDPAKDEPVFAQEDTDDVLNPMDPITIDEEILDKDDPSSDNVFDAEAITDFEEEQSNK